MLVNAAAEEGLYHDRLAALKLNGPLHSVISTYFIDGMFIPNQTAGRRSSSGAGFDLK